MELITQTKLISLSLIGFQKYEKGLKNFNWYFPYEVREDQFSALIETFTQGRNVGLANNLLILPKKFLKDLQQPIDRPRSLKYRYMIIFLDTNDLLLINSFHPISKRHCLPFCFFMKITSWANFQRYFLFENIIKSVYNTL